MVAFEMPADQDLQARAGAPAALLGDLQEDAVEPHGVVAGDDPGFLVTEYLREFDITDRHEGWCRVGGRRRETAVVGGQEPITAGRSLRPGRAGAGPAPYTVEPGP